MGNQHPSVAPYETLHCADGLLAIACGNDGQFRRLTAVLELPEVGADARFASNSDRVLNRAALVPLLEARLGTDTAAAWEQRLAAVGVPAGLVGDLGSAFARAEEYGLDPVIEVGAGRQVRHPVRYENSRTALPTPPPGLGEHSDLVRAWLAGPDGVDLPARGGPGPT
jgi:formyl-CoA transferase